MILFLSTNSVKSSTNLQLKSFNQNLSKTSLCRVDTPNNRQYKTFLIRNLYTFYFRQCFAASFKFLQSVILFFNFLASLMAFFRSIKMKICRNSQSVFTSMVDWFPSCKDVQSAVVQGLKHKYNHGDLCCTWLTIFSL